MKYLCVILSHSWPHPLTQSARVLNLEGRGTRRARSRPLGEYPSFFFSSLGHWLDVGLL